MTKSLQLSGLLGIPAACIAILWLIMSLSQVSDAGASAAWAAWIQACIAALTAVVVLLIYLWQKRDAGNLRRVEAQVLAVEIITDVVDVHQWASEMLMRLPPRVRFTPVGHAEPDDMPLLQNLVKEEVPTIAEHIFKNAHRLYLFDASLGTSIASIISSLNNWKLQQKIANKQVPRLPPTRSAANFYINRFRDIAAAINQSVHESFDGLQSLLHDQIGDTKNWAYKPGPLHGTTPDSK